MPAPPIAIRETDSVVSAFAFSPYIPVLIRLVWQASRLDQLRAVLHPAVTPQVGILTDTLLPLVGLFKELEEDLQAAGEPIGRALKDALGMEGEDDALGFLAFWVRSLCSSTCLMGS